MAKVTLPGRGETALALALHREPLVTLDGPAAQND